MKSFISVFPYLLLATFISISSISVHCQELAPHELNGDDVALSFDDIEYTSPSANEDHEVPSSKQNIDNEHTVQNADMFDTGSSFIQSQHSNIATTLVVDELIDSDTPEDVISGDTGHSYIWTSDSDDTDNGENIWYGDPTQIPECVMGGIDDAQSSETTAAEAATFKLGDENDEEDEIELDVVVDDANARNVEFAREREGDYDHDNRHDVSSNKIAIRSDGENEEEGEEIGSNIPKTVTASTDINSDFETSATASVAATIDESIYLSQQQQQQQDVELNLNVELSAGDESNNNNKIETVTSSSIPISRAEEEMNVEQQVTGEHFDSFVSEPDHDDDNTIATAALLEQQQERERLEKAKKEIEESEQQALFEMLAVQAELAQESYEQYQQESLDESVAEAAEHAAQEVEKNERLEKLKEMEIKRKEQKEQQQSPSSSSRKANEHDKSWHSGLTSRISDRLRQFGSTTSSQQQSTTAAGHGLGSASQSHTRMNSGGGGIYSNNHQFGRSSSSSTRSSGGSHSTLDDLIHKSTGGSGNSNLSIQEKIQQAKMQSLQQQKEKNERFKRYKVPRQYARIVEQIIVTYNDPTTTLYEVLGVIAGGGGSITSSSSGGTSNSAVAVSGRKVKDTKAIHDDDIRRAYRHMLFAVHPDRNPHPDAEKAFDYIQEAYEELINHYNRKTYDYSLFKQKQRKQIFGNWNKMQKVLQESVVNFKARALLFIYRVFRGNKESRRDEYQELLGNRLADLSVDFKHYLEKIVLVPERSDRIQLVNELFSDYWKNIVGISFLIRSCLLPLI